jgi:hypothetical protein
MTTKNRLWRFVSGADAGEGGAAGLAAPPDTGGYTNGYPEGDPLVWRFLRAGSPRLALAQAKGIAIVPLVVSIRATFPDPSTVDVPAVGLQANQGGTPYRLVQDALIDTMIAVVVNKSTTANQNVEQTMSDFFYGFQNGLEVTLTVEGQPRYQVVSQFTPLKNVVDMVSGSSHWPYGWILKPTEQLLMSFHASVPLPYAPLEVITSFRLWTTVSDGDIPSNRQAFSELLDLGYQVPDAIVYNLCR